MSRLRVVMALVLLAMALAILFALARSQDSSAAAGHDPDAAAARASGAAPGSDLIAEREQALQEARAQGRFGQAVARTTRPAPGWVGSRLLNAKTDDWEPAVAADPHHPYLYLLTTRYGAPKACVRCPSPFLALTVSQDGGRTWSAQRQLCICRGHPAQYDPTIEVVPNSGIVYAAFLNATPGNSFSTAFMKSSDHGATWSAPVKVYGKVAWTDKPEITASRSGKDVYVSWNGPSNGDLYVGQSHDYGVTWTRRN